MHTSAGRIIYLALRNPGMRVYEELAEFYDLVYSDEYDLEFYLREAKNARGPVLEIACGTGRILLRLMQAGIPASGIDLSEGMLAVLRNKAAALGLIPDVHAADMRDFSLGRKFRLIIVPYRSFLHLQSDGDRLMALKNFLEHLEPGGRLILHTYNPSKDELLATGAYRHLDSEEHAMPDGTPYTLDWYLQYDRGRRAGAYRIVLTERGREHVFEMEIAYLPVKEVRTLLGMAGYRNIRLYSGFDYGRFEENSKEALWIAEK